ncbi:MAG: cellulase family glycosylhydrolase [Microbacteriaceae bacterium]|nr:cellulase family glycosylhydrolase [Microbacteriaceae bacterium]
MQLTVAQAKFAEMSPASPSASGWLHTDGSVFRTSSNQLYLIKSVSWFGTETTNCSPHGLWKISLARGVAQIKSMGFNTIRLPFSNECLAATATNSIDFTINPALRGKTPLQLIDAVVAVAKAQGMNVILDRHRPDSASQSSLWYTANYSEARWIQDWKALATRYKTNPTVIGMDLHNEPRGQACWGCGDPSVDWQAAATRGGNAVLGVNPKLLIVVEGVENQPDGSSTWWGGGLSGVQANPVRLDVANQVVYSPHDYPSSVAYQQWFTAANYPDNLPAVWDKNWGYIARLGLAPVLLGEFGTKLETSSDSQWMTSIVAYLARTKMSFSYWSFNPNTIDTGGLVLDDWVTPQTAKLAALKPILNPGASPSPSATPSPTPTPSPKATSSPTPSPSPSLSPTKGSSPTASPNPSGAPTPSPTPSPAGSGVGAWSVQTSWPSGYNVVIDVTASGSPIASWTVTWSDPTVLSVANQWGANCSVRPQVSVTCSGAGWAASMPPQQSVRVGIQLNSTGAPASPGAVFTLR